MEEMVKRQDRRVSRTKRAIRNAFLNLLAEKELEKITIREIADGADVDRKTVYNYYSGVYDILDELENELVKDFEKAMEDVEGNFEDRMELFKRLRLFLEHNMETYGMLMRIDGSSRLISKIVVYLQQKISIVLGWTSKVSEEKIALASEFITSGIFTAYRSWFNSDRKQSLEEFTQAVAHLVLGGVPLYFYG